MEANFLRALPLVLKHEGGFSNHKDDPGGATNKGITLENYRRYVKSDGSVADLKNITPKEVERVYNLFYWKAVAGDDLPIGVDYAAFDFGVNSGPGRAIKFMQKVVGVGQDGAIGPQTLAAIRSMPPEILITRLCDDRLAFLKGLSIWATFGKGWGSRVADVRAHALSMAKNARSGVDASPTPTPTPTPPLAPAETGTPTATSPDPTAASKGLVAVVFAAIAGAAAYFWDQIINLFGG